MVVITNPKGTLLMTTETVTHPPATDLVDTSTISEEAEQVASYFDGHAVSQ